uniref:Uncharacterized protein n=1 Tax=Angiostrongylus cantonensis TaxID=6313 RepID=A0A0K0DCI5_ANGCA
MMDPEKSQTYNIVVVVDVGVVLLAAVIAAVAVVAAAVAVLAVVVASVVELVMPLSLWLNESVLPSFQWLAELTLLTSLRASNSEVGKETLEQLNRESV